MRSHCFAWLLQTRFQRPVKRRDDWPLAVRSVELIVTSAAFWPGTSAAWAAISVVLAILTSW